MKMKKTLVIVFSGLIAIIALMVLRQAFFAKTDKNKETKATIEVHLTKGRKYFNEGKLDLAEIEFRNASTKSNRARLKAMASKKPAPKNKLIAKSHEFSFSFREATSRRYLAKTLLRKILAEYSQRFNSTYEKDGPAFTPPTEETEKVIEQLKLGLVAHDRDKNLWQLLGRVESMRGNYRKAIIAFERAIEIDKKFAEAYNDLGVTYANPIFMKSSRGAVYQEKALNAFKTALAVSEGNELPDAHYNLGMFYSSPKDDTGTIDAKSRALSVKHLGSFMKIIKNENSSSAQLAKHTLQRLGAVK